jgi:carboxymethylenebutenolidase
MPSSTIKIPSRDGGAFDCYLSLPEGSGQTPAIVLASAVHGVDKDMRDLTDDFAAAGFIAAAPDLFWRSVPGPLPRDDKRSSERSQPRLEKIKAGEADMADTRAAMRKLAACNGQTLAMGLCYGGPYALIGPKRLGYDAGVTCHGSRMGDYLAELDGVTKPICILWGDQDHAAPPDVLNAYRAVPSKQKNVAVHIFPGVQHGYMMPDAAKAFDAPSRAFSMARALEILQGLRGS